MATNNITAFFDAVREALSPHRRQARLANLVEQLKVAGALRKKTRKTPVRIFAVDRDGQEVTDEIPIDVLEKFVYPPYLVPYLREYLHHPGSYDALIESADGESARIVRFYVDESISNVVGTGEIPIQSSRSGAAHVLTCVEGNLGGTLHPVVFDAAFRTMTGGLAPLLNEPPVNN